MLAQYRKRCSWSARQKVFWAGGNTVLVGGVHEAAEEHMHMVWTDQSWLQMASREDKQMLPVKGEK